MPTPPASRIRFRTRRRWRRNSSPSPARCCMVAPTSSPTRSFPWKDSIASRPRRIWDGSKRRSLSVGDAPPVAGGGDDVADQLEYPVELRRPIGRGAEPNDHQPFGRHDDHILPDRSLGKEGVARPAVLDPVGSAPTVALIGPEAGAVSDPAVRG